MRFRGICYRAHDPKWAFSPLSGEGAASRGGRFNPIGTPALYLSLTLEGMFLEMGHGFAHRFEPLTICSYEVDIEGVVDLSTDKHRKAAGVTLADMACPWALDFANGREPASWAIARRLIANGAAGILVPSFAIGTRADMRNLVAWQWGPKLPHKVAVHDPEHRLPKDQSSWQFSSRAGSLSPPTQAGGPVNTELPAQRLLFSGRRYKRHAGRGSQAPAHQADA